MIRRTRSSLQATVIALMAACAAVSTSFDWPADLATGVRQVNEGDFESALVTLDRVARDLGQEPARAKGVAQAFLYMGVAYVGLRQEGLARTKFQQALGRDPSLRLSPEEFPANVVRVFEATRQAQAEEASLRREAGKKHGRGGLLLLGVGGAAAAGIGIAATKHPAANQAPTNVSIQVSPEGVAILGVSVLTFTATATDADGDGLTYRWDYGVPGQTGVGSSTTFTYNARNARAGQFVVTVFVSDGRAQAQASTQVTVDTLNGIWRFSPTGVVGETHVELTQQGDLGLQAVGLLNGVPIGNPSGGRAQPSREVGFSFGTSLITPACSATFLGTVDAGIRTMSGIETCGPPWALQVCCRLGPLELPLTLIRQ